MPNVAKGLLAGVGLLALLAFEILTPQYFLAQPVAAGPTPLGHDGPHATPDVLCDLPPGNALRKYSLVASAIQWEIYEGDPVIVWAFNGSIPGPTLCARVGDDIEVTLRNDLSTIISFHTHGLEFDPRSDGTFMGRTYAAPGGEYTYRFHAGNLSAGTWAYHDSVAEMDEAPFVEGVTIPESGEGIERGLYGAFVVLDDKVAPVDHEVLLFLGDVGPEVTRRSGVAEVVNGRAYPLTPEISVASGERVRFRVINAGPNDAHDFYVAGHTLVNEQTKATIEGGAAARGEQSVVLGALTFGDWVMTAGAPGVYEYSCAVPGHHAAGMRGFLTVLPKETT